MDTQEMNRVIHEYFIANLSKQEARYLMPDDYEVSWDKLMPVWAKLRDEIDAYYSDNEEHLRQKSFFLIRLRDEIGFEVNITEAHRLIYEAITWLNSKK